MNKHLIRIVTFLLVACLVGETVCPAGATVFEHRTSAQPVLSVFQQQAFMPMTRWVHVVFPWLSRGGRRQLFTGTRLKRQPSLDHITIEDSPDPWPTAPAVLSVLSLTTSLFSLPPGVTALLTAGSVVTLGMTLYRSHQAHFVSGGDLLDELPDLKKLPRAVEMALLGLTQYEAALKSERNLQKTALDGSQAAQAASQALLELSEAWSHFYQLTVSRRYYRSLEQMAGLHTKRQLSRFFGKTHEETLSLPEETHLAAVLEDAQDPVSKAILNILRARLHVRSTKKVMAAYIYSFPRWLSSAGWGLPDLFDKMRSAAYKNLVLFTSEKQPLSIESQLNALDRFTHLAQRPSPDFRKAMLLLLSASLFLKYPNANQLAKALWGELKMLQNPESLSWNGIRRGIQENFAGTSSARVNLLYPAAERLAESLRIDPQERLLQKIFLQQILERVFPSKSEIKQSHLMELFISGLPWVEVLAKMATPAAVNNGASSETGLERPAPLPVSVLDTTDWIERIIRTQADLKHLSEESFLLEAQRMSADLKRRRKAGDSVEAVAVESLALFREMSRRFLRQKTHAGLDVVEPTPKQLQAALTLLLNGPVAVQQETGNGKTVSLAMAAYVWALEGRGVHIHTNNPYLAERDARWTSIVFKRLGMSVDFLNTYNDLQQHQHAFRSDITYGAYSDFIFDDLWDGLELDPARRRQRPHLPAAILVDDAHIPLISVATDPLGISIPTQVPVPETRLNQFLQVARTLNPAGYTLDPRTKTVVLTPAGLSEASHLLGQDPPLDAQTRVDIQDALAALHLHQENFDYVIQKNEIKLLDASMRIREGVVWEGQTNNFIALKERHVGNYVRLISMPITNRLITPQVYYSRRSKLLRIASATLAEARWELADTYQLPLVVIPVSEHTKRLDQPMRYFQTQADRRRFVVKTVLEVHRMGRPVLLATRTIAEAQWMRETIERLGPSVRLLTALNSQDEASIIARAGERKAITIAAGMAGCGSDIRGDLFVMGSEAGLTDWADGQLRGRAARWNDPGETLICASLEDDLFRHFVPAARLEQLRPSSAQTGELDPAVMQPLLHLARTTAQAFQEGLRRDMLEPGIQLEDYQDNFFNEIVSKASDRRLAEELLLKWRTFLEENGRLRRQLVHPDYVTLSTKNYDLLILETSRLLHLSTQDLDARYSAARNRKTNGWYTQNGGKPALLAHIGADLRTVVSDGWTLEEIAYEAQSKSYKRVALDTLKRILEARRGRIYMTTLQRLATILKTLKQPEVLLQREKMRNRAAPGQRLFDPLSAFVVLGSGHVWLDHPVWLGILTLAMLGMWYRSDREFFQNIIRKIRLLRWKRWTKTLPENMINVETIPAGTQPFDYIPWSKGPAKSPLHTGYQWVNEHLSHEPSVHGLILDIGGGEGMGVATVAANQNMEPWFIDSRPVLFGLDPVTGRLIKAAGMAHGLIGPAEHIFPLLRDERFDVITLVRTLGIASGRENMATYGLSPLNPSHVLAQAYRLLKPGGRLLIWDYADELRWARINLKDWVTHAGFKRVTSDFVRLDDSYTAQNLVAKKPLRFRQDPWPTAPVLIAVLTLTASLFPLPPGVPALLAAGSFFALGMTFSDMRKRGLSPIRTVVEVKRAPMMLTSGRESSSETGMIRPAQARYVELLDMSLLHHLSEEQRYILNESIGGWTPLANMFQNQSPFGFLIFGFEGGPSILTKGTVMSKGAAHSDLTLLFDYVPLHPEDPAWADQSPTLFAAIQKYFDWAKIRFHRVEHPGITWTMEPRGDWRRRVVIDSSPPSGGGRIRARDTLPGSERRRMRFPWNRTHSGARDLFYRSLAQAA